MSEAVAVVTGATGGIGSAVAARLARDGTRVIGVDVASPFSAGGGTQAFRELLQTSDLVCHEEVDVADCEGMRALFERIERQHGSVGAIVNNAAVTIYKSLMETGEREWERLLAVNVKGIFNSVRYGAPLMEPGGAIVNIGSVHSVATGTRHAAYAATKGAVEAVTRSLALELSPMGVRVNCLLPGAVRTSMLAAGLESEDSLKELQRRTPMGRIGEPKEIAEVVAFLLGRSASFMTGSTVTVDGGATALLATETLR